LNCQRRRPHRPKVCQLLHWAWTMIIVINISLILLVMVINHKDYVKPQRVAVKKTIARPKPRPKKITK
jgi:hypothetical protein